MCVYLCLCPELHPEDKQRIHMVGSLDTRLHTVTPLTTGLSKTQDCACLCVCESGMTSLTLDILN